MTHNSSYDYVKESLLLQSKGIPATSADMTILHPDYPSIRTEQPHLTASKLNVRAVPSWSLDRLLEILPMKRFGMQLLQRPTDGRYIIFSPRTLKCEMPIVYARTPRKCVVRAIVWCASLKPLFSSRKQSR